MMNIFYTISTLLLTATFAVMVQAATQDSAPASPRPEWHEPLTGMVFVALPAGCFRMGNPDALRPEKDRQLLDAGYRSSRFADEAPVHEVCVDSFWIGRTEVQARQWQQLMGSPPPSGEDNAPAAAISWQQAQVLADRLTEQSQGHYRFRLPTEAEWEYACRGGRAATTKAFAVEDQLDSAWYSDSRQRIAQPASVGQLSANSWGLHDMRGNVWEWTLDSYSANSYQQHAYRNPLTINTGPDRVIRGASFRSNYKELRCSSRGSYRHDQGMEQIGLRLVRSATR